MNKLQHDNLLELLKHIRKRPGMYFTDDMAAIDNFISGFDAAIRIFFDHSNTPAIYLSLLRERKLEPNRSPYQQLRERGFNHDDAIYEYVSLLIDLYKDVDIN